MKIVCPECQAAYEIDIPESPVKDVSAKCAVCNSKFLVRKGSSTQTRHTHKTMSGPPLAHIDSASDTDPDDDFLFGLQEDFSELYSDHEDNSSEDEKTLDDYLDKLLEEELEEPTHQAIAKPAEQIEVDSTNFEMPSEEELDDLFDSIITEEIKTEDPQENPKASTASVQTDLSEDDLDALFDDIINDMDSTESGDAVEGIDKNETVLTDPDLLFEEKDEASETETEGSDVAIPAIYSAKVTNQEDLLEDIPAEEKNSNQIDPEEDLEIASDASVPETSEPAVIDSDDEENDVEAQAEADIEQISEEKDSPSLAEAFADQEATEAPATDAKEETAQEPEEEKSDDDLWAEAFADQEATEAPATDAKEETAQEPEEEKSDDDLWAEAFADQEATEAPATDVKEETAQEPQAETALDEEPNEKNAIPELEYDDADDDKEEVDAEEEDPYAEYDDDEEDFSPPPKKKSGIFSLPSTLTGKLVLGSGVLAVLLTGGGIYFTLQTLAPPELTQMGKTESEIPDGLKSKQVEETPTGQQNDSGNATSATDQQVPALASEPASPANPEKAPDITQALAKTNNPLDVAMSSDVSEGLVASFAPSNHAVELTAILPVAYNVNDIRVLSFSLEVEMSDEESAQVVREALPVFEKITLTTIEQLLEKEFFNDILYVQEKLKKNLQTNFNKTLTGGGRVKKINFKEFTIQ
jgi:predicted Zn finger-like uncharacterized protein